MEENRANRTKRVENGTQRGKGGGREQKRGKEGNKERGTETEGKMSGLKGHLFGFGVLCGRDLAPKGDSEIEIGYHPEHFSSKLSILSRQREHMRTKTCARIHAPCVRGDSFHHKT